MTNLIFLPATEPGDTTYGEAPGKIAAYPNVRIHPIRYPHLVWYNRTICDEAIAQIRAFDVTPLVLVGFSKSGLGAWNIAREIPNLVSATIIFDAPVTRQNLPPWGTDPFYKDDKSWQTDQPINTIKEFQAAMSDSHKLILISGTGFHDEMSHFSEELSKSGCSHVFLPRPNMVHHWTSGWIEEGLSNFE